MKKSITTGQKRDLRKLFAEALDEFGLGRELAQRVLAKGGRMKASIKELLSRLGGPDLLELVGTVNLSAVKRFMVEDHFKEGKIDGVWIKEIDKKLKRLIIGKVETDVSEATLRIRQICQSSMDGQIIAELGGAEMVETTFAHMWQLLQEQGCGEKGYLLINGLANIFFIRINGILWAISVYFRSGWIINAYLLGSPDGWGVGRQVYSYN